MRWQFYAMLTWVVWGFWGYLPKRALASLDPRSVLVLEGINDVKAGTSAEQVIAGLKQYAATAHAYGRKIVVATITPFKGWPEYTAQAEAWRESVNNFILANGGIFDATVDFDAVIRDPEVERAYLGQ